eukprot:TRINITY_DN779_c0_g1_i2.p2 TRINITY_DN779_c0_g1~~TRINITY_DN779_c0_g1_i2.p2  ORF type:complete len:129 (-),score=40.84 TRINITY_DN779_c0_g1_i2:27-413(-)
MLKEVLGLNVTVAPPIDATAKNQDYWNQFFDMIANKQVDMDAFLERDYSFYNATKEGSTQNDINRMASDSVDYFASGSIPIEYGWYIPEYAYDVGFTMRDVDTMKTKFWSTLWSDCKKEKVPTAWPLV